MIYLLIVIAVWFSFPFTAKTWREVNLVKPRLPKRKTPFDVLPFVLSLQIALEGASSIRKAIELSLPAVPEDELQFTRAAIASEAEISKGLLADVNHHHELAPLALAVAIFEFAGAGVGSVIENLTSDVLQSRNEQAEIQAELAASKATIAVLAGLPILGIVMGGIMGANPIGWLIANRFGYLCLGLAALLELAGLVWIRRLIAKATR